MAAAGLYFLLTILVATTQPYHYYESLCGGCFVCLHPRCGDDYYYDDEEDDEEDGKRFVGEEKPEGDTSEDDEKSYPSHRSAASRKSRHSVRKADDEEEAAPTGEQDKTLSQSFDGAVAASASAVGGMVAVAMSFGKSDTSSPPEERSADKQTSTNNTESPSTESPSSNQEAASAAVQPASNPTGIFDFMFCGDPLKLAEETPKKAKAPVVIEQAPSPVEAAPQVSDTFVATETPPEKETAPPVVATEQE